MIKNENAQLYTVEGIAASIMMLIVVIFVIKAAPLSSSTSSSSNKDVEAQLEILGQDILTTLDFKPEDRLNSHLKEFVVGWNNITFSGNPCPVSPESSKYTCNAIQEALGDDGIAYNLELKYEIPENVSTSSLLDQSAVFWNGNPSDNAVIVYKRIVLHDDDPINSNSPIQNIDNLTTNYFNIVMVRLTLWRI